MDIPDLGGRGLRLGTLLLIGAAVTGVPLLVGSLAVVAGSLPPKKPRVGLAGGFAMPTDEEARERIQSAREDRDTGRPS